MWLLLDGVIELVCRAMSQKLDLRCNVVDIMSHLARPGGGLMTRAWALADLRFPVVGHGLVHISQTGH